MGNVDINAAAYRSYAAGSGAKDPSGNGKPTGAGAGESGKAEAGTLPSM
jgi:hypothetical protein